MKRRFLRGAIASVAVAATTAAAAITATPVAGADPSGGTDAAAWQAAVDAPDAYPNTAVEWDVPITMSDGTVLRANVFRPADANGTPIAEPTPVVLNLTPYTKLVSTLATVVGDDPTLAPLVEGLGEGVPTVVKSGGQASNVLSAAAAADGFALVPRGTGLVAEGEQITVEMFKWPEAREWADGR